VYYVTWRNSVDQGVARPYCNIHYPKHMTRGPDVESIQVKRALSKYCTMTCIWQFNTPMLILISKQPILFYHLHWVAKYWWRNNYFKLKLSLTGSDVPKLKKVQGNVKTKRTTFGTDDLALQLGSAGRTVHHEQKEHIQQVLIHFLLIKAETRNS